MGLCSDEDFEAAGLFCPACGTAALVLRSRALVCEHHGCPRPDAAAQILADSEIHHVVRFDGDEEYGVFNAKHPLRERIGSELLDCVIHEEVRQFVADNLEANQSLTGTWRVKHVRGANEWSYVWERM